MSNFLKYKGNFELHVNVKKTTKAAPSYNERDFEALRRGFQEEYIDPYNLVSETVDEIKDNISKY